MKAFLPRIALLGLLLPAAFLPLSAQTAGSLPEGTAALKPGSPEDLARTMGEAFVFRKDLAKAVVAGGKTPQEALAALKQRPSPSGLQTEVNTDLALAVLDLGQQLLASKHPELAEFFFLEAEISLGRAIDALPETSARAKAGLLEHRAYIRANYLNKTPGADADLARAIELQPEDKRLQRQRDSLPAAKAGRNDAVTQAN